MSGPVVDLRSDTVTRPTPEMRRAMADAEVGDDAYGEDPTVNALEAAFAERVGKAAAVFVPSGTMGNQLAVRVLARPGTLVICGARAHLAVHEGGAASYNSGVQLYSLADPGGRIDPAGVRWVVEAAAHHQPDPGLVWLENTYMHAAGAVLRPDELAPLVAAGAGLPVHLDGARLWNAEVASGIPAARLAAPATTEPRPEASETSATAGAAPVSWATSASASSSMSTAVTTAPSAVIARQTARPMPPPAPVTTIRLPSSSPIPGNLVKRAPPP